VTARRRKPLAILAVIAVLAVATLELTLVLEKA
jgi:hypothetical protein